MKYIKRILLPWVCRTFLRPKSFWEYPKSAKRVECSLQDIQVLTHTSNNVIRIKKENGYYYFRECKRHTDVREYVNDLINYYYEHIHPELVCDGMFLKKRLSKKSNLKKFINMGITNDFSSGAYKFCSGLGGNSIGLGEMDPDTEYRIKDFVQYVWGELFAYKLNSGLKKDCYQTYNAVRSISTYRISKLLNIHHLIPYTDYAVILIDGREELFGTIMFEAPGVSSDKIDVNTRKQICSPSLQRSLNILNFLDVICLEKDHRPSNYNVILKNQDIVSIVAFDNDSPNSFGLGGISFETYVGCSPLIVGKYVNRPYIDSDLAERIKKLTYNDLKTELGDLLNKYQLFSLGMRLKKMQQILRTTPDKKLLTPRAWSKQTIAEELSGEYGKTYLTEFLNGTTNINQPWIKDKNDYAL